MFSSKRISMEQNSFLWCATKQHIGHYIEEHNQVDKGHTGEKMFTSFQLDNSCQLLS